MIAIHNLFGHIVIQEGLHTLKVSVRYLVLGGKNIWATYFQLDY